MGHKPCCLTLYLQQQGDSHFVRLFQCALAGHFSNKQGVLWEYSGGEFNPILVLRKCIYGNVVRVESETMTRCCLGGEM